jgi:hypothetical protein
LLTIGAHSLRNSNLVALARGVAAPAEQIDLLLGHLDLAAHHLAQLLPPARKPLSFCCGCHETS